MILLSLSGYVVEQAQIFPLLTPFTVLVGGGLWELPGCWIVAGI